MHVCPRCHRSTTIPTAQPATAEGPPNAYVHVAGHHPQPAAIPQRVKIGSRKAAPSATALREERERKKREEEEAALSAKLRFTRPKGAPTTGGSGSHSGNSPASKALHSGSGSGSGKSGTGSEEEEDENYYHISDHREMTDKERIEAFRKIHEERLNEKHMELRRRQGVARRPKALLRTRYGQFKSIDNGPANAQTSSQENGDAHRDGDGQQEEEPPLLLLHDAPADREEQLYDDGDHRARQSPEERTLKGKEAEEPSRSTVAHLVHPSAQLEIDCDEDGDGE